MEVAAHLALIVAQLGQAVLQLQHAVVAVAVLQLDIVGVGGGVLREDGLLQLGAGLLDDGQAVDGAEAGQAVDGALAEGVLSGADQAAQLVQALVQLGDADAAVAGLEIDVAGALRGLAAHQLLERFNGCVAGRAQTVLALEEHDGLLRAAAELAVRLVGQIAQIAQTVLHRGNANAAAAAAHGQACVLTPEKCSKRDTFRWGKTLHKAEISFFCRRKSRFFLLS